MNPRRTLINVITFLVITSGLVYFGATRFLFPQQEGRTLTMETADASGLVARSDVTIRGIPAGSVQSVQLTDRGTATVTLQLDPGVTVPRGTTANITRRSPIGDFTVDLTPGQGAPLPDDGHIPMEDVAIPPDPIRTIEALADTLGALTPEDLSSLTQDLAIGLRGRGDDLGRLAVVSADLQERILEVHRELESLIRTGPEVLDVLAENAPTLADDITLTALLADILRDRRFDLVELSRSGGDFAEAWGNLLASQKANLSCLIEDFGHVNEVLARPGNLEDLVSVLELNHFFFGGADQSVQQSNADPYAWFRVHFLPPQEPPARKYARNRPPPDVFAGHGCHSRYGDGVGPATQDHEPFVAPESEFHPGK